MNKMKGITGSRDHGIAGSRDHGIAGSRDRGSKDIRKYDQRISKSVNQ